MNKQMLSFVAGLLVGAAAMYRYMSNKTKTKFVYISESNDTPFKEVETTEPVAVEVIEKEAAPIEKDYSSIRPISESMYEDETEFEKIELDFYTDGILKEWPHDDDIPFDVIGGEENLTFGLNDDPDICYVRNSRLGIDYEITNKQMPYYGEEETE